RRPRARVTRERERAVAAAETRSCQIAQYDAKPCGTECGHRPSIETHIRVASAQQFERRPQHQVIAEGLPDRHGVKAEYACILLSVRRRGSCRGGYPYLPERQAVIRKSECWVRDSDAPH